MAPTVVITISSMMRGFSSDSQSRALALVCARGEPRAGALMRPAAPS